MQEAEVHTATRQHMEINSKEHQSQGVQRRYQYSLGKAPWRRGHFSQLSEDKYNFNR